MDDGLLRYQVGVDVDGGAVTLGVLDARWRAVLHSMRPGVPPADRVSLNREWTLAIGRLRRPVDLELEEAKALVAHNLALDVEDESLRIVIGENVFTMRAALAQLEQPEEGDRSRAAAIISLGRHFAAALLATSGLPLERDDT